MTYTDAELLEIDGSPERRRAYFWRIAQRLKLEGDAWEKSLGEFMLENLELISETCEVGS